MFSRVDVERVVCARAWCGYDLHNEVAEPRPRQVLRGWFAHVECFLQVSLDKRPHTDDVAPRQSLSSVLLPVAGSGLR